MSKSPRRRWRIQLPPFRAMVRFITGRTYAIALLLVAGYAGYMAFAYLLDNVFSPARTPKSILDWELRSDVDSRRDPHAAGIATESGRAPMAHYHLVSRRPEFDAGNGCTISGCHQPLPHSPKMKVPAFANLHTAFLACQTCHTDARQRPVKTVWMNWQDGSQLEPPAVMRLDRLLHDEAEKIQKRPGEVHAPILALGRAILQLRPQDHVLQDLLFQIETAEPGSPVWRGAIAHLAGELPRYARGDYGGKLIPEAQRKTYLDSNRQMKELAAQYLAAPEKSPQRKTLDDQIHSAITKKAPGCAVCHSDAPGLLDFADVGYPPARAKALGNLQLARILEQIRTGGGEFRLPTLMEGSDGK